MDHNMHLVGIKFLGTALLFVDTLVAAKLVSFLLSLRSSKKLHPPRDKGPPPVGVIVRFVRRLISLISEEYLRLGSMYTLRLFHKKVMLLLGREVSVHFFKALEVEMSQQEMYQFNVPFFSPSIVFDVDYSVRQAQFRFFRETLRVIKLKSYVAQMISDVERSSDRVVKNRRQWLRD